MELFDADRQARVAAKYPAPPATEAEQSYEFLKKFFQEDGQELRRAISAGVGLPAWTPSFLPWNTDELGSYTPSISPRDAWILWQYFFTGLNSSEIMMESRRGAEGTWEAIDPKYFRASSPVIWRSDVIKEAVRGAESLGGVTIDMESRFYSHAYNVWGFDRLLPMTDPLYPDAIYAIRALWFPAVRKDKNTLKTIIFGTIHTGGDDTAPPVIIRNCGEIAHGQILPESDGNGDLFAKQVYAMICFMDLPFVLPQETPIPRADRRRTEKKCYSAPQVKTIVLRQLEKCQGADEEITEDRSTGRHLTCRFIVKPHWRRQWYPSKKVHAPIRIEAYMKGPETAPFSQIKTVKVVRR